VIHFVTSHASLTRIFSSFHAVSRRSPRKVERRPTYVLNLVLPPATVDLLLDPAKTTVQFEVGEVIHVSLLRRFLTRLQWPKDPDTVSRFVASVIQAFLVRHGFAIARINASVPTPGEGEGSSLPKKKRRKLQDDVREDRAQRPLALSQCPSPSPALSTAQTRGLGIFAMPVSAPMVPLISFDSDCCISRYPSDRRHFFIFNQACHA
jgi:hypothetical protein